MYDFTWEEEFGDILPSSQETPYYYDDEQVNNREIKMDEKVYQLFDKAFSALDELMTLWEQSYDNYCDDEYDEFDDTDKFYLGTNESPYSVPEKLEPEGVFITLDGITMQFPTNEMAQRWIEANI